MVSLSRTFFNRKVKYVQNTETRVHSLAHQIQERQSRSSHGPMGLLQKSRREGVSQHTLRPVGTRNMDTREKTVSRSIVSVRKLFSKSCPKLCTPQSFSFSQTLSINLSAQSFPAISGTSLYSPHARHVSPHSASHPLYPTKRRNIYSQ